MVNILAGSLFRLFSGIYFQERVKLAFFLLIFMYLNLSEAHLENFRLRNIAKHREKWGKNKHL